MRRVKRRFFGELAMAMSLMLPSVVKFVFAAWRKQTPDLQSPMGSESSEAEIKEDDEELTDLEYSVFQSELQALEAQRIASCVRETWFLRTGNRRRWRLARSERIRFEDEIAMLYLCGSESLIENEAA